MKKNNWKKVFGAVFISLVLVLGLMGCATEKLDQQPAEKQEEIQETEKSEPVETPEAEESEETSEEAEDEYFDVDSIDEEAEDYSKYEEKESPVEKAQSGNVEVSDGTQTEADQYETEPVPEGQQLPVEPEDAQIDKSVEKTCYLTISCATILNNMDDLTAGKEGLVPSDGILYARTAVTFYEGESVFDVLSRETRNNRIHMESRFTPMYNSAYIAGIGNLYEFDCGDNSGWMYCVNGWYPNYGVSRYVVQDQDEIIFNYTCDLGRDLGQDWM